jgi:hypothetical protein
VDLFAALLPGTLPWCAVIAVQRSAVFVVYAIQVTQSRALF